MDVVHHDRGALSNADPNTHAYCHTNSTPSPTVTPTATPTPTATATPTATTRPPLLLRRQLRQPWHLPLRLHTKSVGDTVRESNGKPISNRIALGDTTSDSGDQSLDPDASAGRRQGGHRRVHHHREVAPKQVLLRAIGPSLTHFGVPDVLADPVLELHGQGGFATIINDNWRDTQEDEIQATGIPPQITSNQRSWRRWLREPIPGS